MFLKYKIIFSIIIFVSRRTQCWLQCHSSLNQIKFSLSSSTTTHSDTLTKKSSSLSIWSIFRRWYSKISCSVCQANAIQSHYVQVYLSNCSIRVVDGTAFSNLALMIELDLSNNKDRCTLELLINLHYKTTLSMLYSNIILKWMQKLTFLSDTIKNQNAEQTKLQLPSQQ